MSIPLIEMLQREHFLTKFHGYTKNKESSADATL